MIGNRLVTRGLGGRAMVIGGLAEPGTYEAVIPARWAMGTLTAYSGGGTLTAPSGGGTLTAVQGPATEEITP